VFASGEAEYVRWGRAWGLALFLSAAATACGATTGVPPTVERPRHDRDAELVALSEAPLADDGARSVADTEDTRGGGEEAPLAPPPPTDSGEAPPNLVPFRVGHERAVWTLPQREGAPELPLVYLHGRCGDPKAFSAFGHAAAKRGTIISFVGDEPCKDGRRFKWSGDVVSLDRRISRTLVALDQANGTHLAASERAVIGYSQGSLMAEALATRFPERYPRVALIGGPRAPKDGSLSKTKAILLMAGTRDLRDHLREAKDELARRGRTVRYVEFEGARHGEYGPAAEHTMADALDWLLGVTK
jgi:predicted esterase